MRGHIATAAIGGAGENGNREWAVGDPAPLLLCAATVPLWGWVQPGMGAPQVGCGSSDASADVCQQRWVGAPPSIIPSSWRLHGLGCGGGGRHRCRSRRWHAHVQPARPKSKRCAGALLLVVYLCRRRLPYIVVAGARQWSQSESTVVFHCPQQGVSAREDGSVHAVSGTVTAMAPWLPGPSLPVVLAPAGRCAPSTLRVCARGGGM